MNILFASIPFIGHMNPLLFQARELHRRGHSVRFAAASDLRDHVTGSAPEIAFVDLGPLGEAEAVLQRATRAASLDPSFARGTSRLMSSLSCVWGATYDGVARELSRARPAGLVVDFFTSAAMAAAETAGLVFVVNNPDLLAALSVKLLPPADHLPSLFSGRRLSEVGWSRRLLAPLTRRLGAGLVSATVGREVNALRRQRGLRPVDVHTYLHGRTILVNGAFGIEYPRPLPPGVHMVGPMLPPSPTPLPPAWDDWLTDGSPVVYVNFGTLAAPAPRLVGIVHEALARLPLRTLWIRRPPGTDHERDARLRIVPWGPPPLAVLSHPNVCACVSHCGINSAYESLAAGVPLVAVPMLADQRDMAARVVDAGAGLALDKRRLRADDLHEALLRVTQERRFRDAVALQQATIHGAGGVTRAADLIEAALG